MEKQTTSGKIEEAQDILKGLGLPKAQQNEMSALTLLALCGVAENDSWTEAYQHSLTVTKGVMDYVKKQYGRDYAPNTRETFRRQVLHQFVQARVADYNPDNEELPTNSPLAHYAITKEALSAIKNYGTDKWKKEAQKFIKKQGSLASKYEKRRSFDMVSVTLNDGKKLKLSPGKHNEVQAAVINEFAPRFSPGASVLYFGDTANKKLFIDDGGLLSLGIEITDHDKLPDAVIYDKNRNWLFLIEVVTSHGPMTPKRVFELEDLFEKCPAGKVYVSAFPDFSEFRKHTKEIAWETEVWIAEIPDHMIHYNGDRFLGPR
jgi:hypothetical protein